MIKIEKNLLINIIVFIVAVFITVSISFFVFHKLSDNKIKKIQNELSYALENAKQIEKRNNELINQCEQLQNLNKEMKDEFNEIKNLTHSANETLTSLSYTTNNITSKIEIIKENQKLFKEYINKISSIVEE